jgi:hypothetical protein
MDSNHELNRFLKPHQVSVRPACADMKGATISATLLGCLERWRKYGVQQ